MKCITLTAPWSWLVTWNLKQIETRSWRTNHRGLLGIHTAQSLAPIGGEAGLLDVCSRPWFREALIVMGITKPLAVPRGVICGVCSVRDVRPTAELLPEIEAMELAFGDYSPNRYGWLLDGCARLTTPIKAKGAQGLWTWGDELPAVASPPPPPDRRSAQIPLFA